MKFSPRRYQLPMVQHMIQHDRCAVWAGMGMGKTSACLLYLTYLLLYTIDKILIIAPLRVARDVWPVEIKKWDDFKHLSCSPIIGTLSQRKKALQKDADIYTINYENLPWLLSTVNSKWPWKTVILDESTRIKSFRLRQGGQRARVLAKVAWSKIERLIELTGTPSPNGLLDLWGQMWFIDKGKRLERTYTVFTNRYFRYKHPNSYELIPLESTPRIINEKLKDVCISLKSEDYFDLKKPIHYKVPVYLNQDCRNLYDDFQKEMYIKLQDDTEVTANFAASLSIKSLQFVNGAVYKDEDKNFTEVHRLKIEALTSIIEELPGENIIVSYHFKSDLARLKKHFPQGRELDQKPQTLKDWNSRKISLLFAHPASAGHGLNLQDGGRTIVFFGHWWNLEHREQIVERIGPTRQFQSGYNRSVYIYDIYAYNTIDEIVLARHRSKKSVQELLINAMRKDLI